MGFLFNRTQGGKKAEQRQAYGKEAAAIRSVGPRMGWVCVHGGGVGRDWGRHDTLLALFELPQKFNQKFNSIHSTLPENLLELG